MKEEWIAEGFKDLKDYEVVRDIGAEGIREFVAVVIRDCADPDHTSPSWIANVVYRELDPKNAAPSLVKMSALLTLEEIARELHGRKSWALMRWWRRYRTSTN